MLILYLLSKVNIFSVGLAVCHVATNQPGFSEMWQKALENGMTIRLFRDEVILIHQYLQAFFESIKGYNNIIYLSMYIVWINVGLYGRNSTICVPLELIFKL